jgi:hypothetical protein
MQLASNHKAPDTNHVNQHEPADVSDVHGDACFITTRGPSLTKRSIDHSTIRFVEALKIKDVRRCEILFKV